MELDDLALSWNTKESLAGKIALVTGANSGIGALEFSQAAGYSEEEIRAFTSNILPLHPDNVAEVALYGRYDPHAY
ncbi:hypothetical protein [Paenibacillus guangzhouensis]|uniref:hypothetical protein n=1 Tax=Paenibacillus guangzhouensis TaxID=1473112 RepID=UPI001D123D4F|nr:hypothetical protein [Paenibacillus guangzhouensis]